jgi:hypothetical protein
LGLNPDAAAGSVRPWYRQPYVWLLIAFPALSIAGGLATLWLAASTNDGLVVDDYYRQGLLINETKQRDRVAATYALDAELETAGDAGQLTVILRGNERFRAPERITVTFAHRTRAGFDRRLILGRVGDAAYAGHRPQLPAGTWDILIEAGDWRLLKATTIRERDTRD